MKTPKTCKEWKNKVIQLKVGAETAGGERFYPGELLVVKRKTKDGKYELARRPGKINLYGDDLMKSANLVGDEKDIFQSQSDVES